MCSKNVFTPIITSTIPPKSSAFAPSSSPNFLPPRTPASEIAKVTVPIKAAAGTIFTPIAANDLIPFFSWEKIGREPVIIPAIF